MGDKHLYYYTIDNVKLRTIIRPLDEDVALLYGGFGCQFAIVSNATKAGNDQFRFRGNSLSPQQFYEARIFGRGYEVRWLSHGRGDRCGKAVWLCDNEDGGPQSVTGNDWGEAAKKLYLECYDQDYLLWGKPAEEERDDVTGQRWTRLREFRIGDLWVPCAIEAGKRVFLRTKEYLGVEDDYGNVGVLAECLVELCCKPEKAEDE
ncbi:type III-D CRISPR-associated protein Csx19 [Desulfarculus baarsii]